jgi:RNA polymerase sigma-70 factor (ECF subfamily)
MTSKEFKNKFMIYHPKLYRIAYSILGDKGDAEDILQETYTKLWQKREQLNSIRNPESYCVSLIKNASYDLHRSFHKKHRKVDICETNEESTYKIEDNIEQSDRIVLVNRLIQKLPDKQKQVLRLSAIKELDNKEIEEITGFSNVNIRTLLSRARKTLKAQFEKYE